MDESSINGRFHYCQFDKIIQNESHLKDLHNLENKLKSNLSKLKAVKVKKTAPVGPALRLQADTEESQVNLPQLLVLINSQLQDVITQTVSYWLPYINIEEIDVEMTDAMKDNHTAHMTIQFTVGNTIETQEITFTVRG